MTHGASWADLVAELKTSKWAAEPLRADWFAYVGSENYGIWFFGVVDRATEEVRAAFGLFAARVIEKLGIQPIPTPQPLEHFPAWKLYCEVEEELARLQGKTIDLSDAVPFGLGATDCDAVDSCTRAWLEILRRESRAFQSSGGGTLTIKGGDKLYPSLGGNIPDVWAASAVYCMWRARDEIGTRLINNAGLTGRTLAENAANSPEAIVSPPASRLVAQEYQRRDEAAGQRELQRERDRDTLKRKLERDCINGKVKYPKEVYDSGGRSHVVFGLEDHLERRLEGWVDEKPPAAPGPEMKMQTAAPPTLDVAEQTTAPDGAKQPRRRREPHARPEEFLAGKDQVTYETTMKVLGIGKRRVQQLALEEGCLKRTGTERRPMITTASIREYLKRSNNAQ